MSQQTLYLKPNVVIEPLFDSWYAWMHLVSPATAARNIARRHLPIMRSYVQARDVHVAASRNPKMRGGPFVNYDVDRTQEIRNLCKRTAEKRANLLALAEALDELNGLIAAHAPGSAVEPLYARVPERLRGYVELVFDLRHNLSFRLIEPLLYRSSYYDRSAQTLALWRTTAHERPFVLSTPRLPEDQGDALHLPIPFDSDLVDVLGEMRLRPRAASDVLDRLDLSEAERGLFMQLLTPEGGHRHVPCIAGTVRTRYFGHACVLVETADVSVLVDPLIAYPLDDARLQPFTWLDLPETIDYVLITHNHQDHALLETLLPLRHKIRTVVVPRTGSGALQDPSLRLGLEQIGFRRVVELGELDVLRDGKLEITGVPFFGEHADLNIQCKLCYHLRLGAIAFLFAADSAVLDRKVYVQVQSALGGVDVLFLGMECDGAPLSWLYGPLLSAPLSRELDNARRLSGSKHEQAMELVDIFRPTEIYVYAMGQEPWVEFISSIKYTEESRPIVESNRLISECNRRGIRAERLFGSKELVHALD